MPLDPDAIAELVGRHAAALALYARRFCAAPEDAAQQALVKLALLSVPPDDPAAWLFRVCEREALQLARSERRRKQRERAAAWFRPCQESGADGEAVQLALAALERDEAGAVTLHLWGGLTFAQVGAVQGTSAATAHRRYQSGLARLRELLKEDGCE